MQAKDLVVNNAAAVSKTFKLLSPSAGLGAIASWYLREGPISSVFPSLTTSANRSTVSRVDSAQVKFKLPSSFTDSVTGLTNVGSHAELTVNVRIPQDFPEALRDDFVAYSLNLLGTDVVKSLVRDCAPNT